MRYVKEEGERSKRKKRISYFICVKGQTSHDGWIYARSCKQNRFNNAARLNNKEIRIHHNTTEEAEAAFSRMSARETG